jgi:hypothetical protein
MTIKQETSLQRSIQHAIVIKGGYIPKKNHGNMITIKCLQDLPFVYKGFSCFFEIKLPNYTTADVSEHQGIHCRLARKALALTAIVSSVEETYLILDELDRCSRMSCTPAEMLLLMDTFFEKRGLDDGTKY